MGNKTDYRLIIAIQKKSSKGYNWQHVDGQIKMNIYVRKSLPLFLAAVPFIYPSFLLLTENPFLIAFEIFLIDTRRVICGITMSSAGFNPFMQQLVGRHETHFNTTFHTVSEPWARGGQWFIYVADNTHTHRGVSSCWAKFTSGLTLGCFIFLKEDEIGTKISRLSFQYSRQHPCMYI